MRTIHLCIIAILCGFAALSSFVIRDAVAQPVAIDAGPGVHDAGAPTAGSAAATPAPQLPDPIKEPVESVGYVVKLWKSGTMPAAFIVGMFLLLTTLRTKVKALQKGYASIICASLIGGLAMLLEAASRGTTPTVSMFATALVTAVALGINPRKPEPATT